MSSTQYKLIKIVEGTLAKLSRENGYSIDFVPYPYNCLTANVYNNRKDNWHRARYIVKDDKIYAYKRTPIGDFKPLGSIGLDKNTETKFLKHVTASY